MSIQLRRGTNADRALITPSEGELIYTTDTKVLYVGDGSTLGGNQVSNAGSLGGTLGDNVNLNSFNINGPSLVINGTNGSIIAPSFTGAINASLGSNLTTGSRSITNGSNLTINGSTGVITASSFVGNIKGSVYSQGNALRLSSSTNFFSNGNVTIDENLITTTNNQLQLGNNTGMLLKLKSNEDQGISIIGVSVGTASSGTSPSFKVITSAGTLASPESLDTGSLIFSHNFFGKDTVNSDILSSQILIGVDNNESVATGAVPGKFIFLTCPTNDTYSIFTFDSQGRFGINRLDATETLDVDGTAKFTGHVQFGSYTTTARNAFTPANGMVIYNTSSNRFEGYQNGGWIHLDNGTSAA